MFELLKIFTLLLLIAFALLTVAKKFKIPYSIVLVLSGFAVSLFKFHLNFHVSYETIMLVFIPALVFKEAISLAMLIALPMSLGNEFVFKACIIGYSIIMFSILIQGSLLRLTAKKLL